MKASQIYKHHYLRTLTTIVCLFITAIGIVYTVGSYQFFKTHFSNNVSINGIDVSRMSRKKAFEKVNEQGKNWMVLRDGKIRTSHYLNTNDFVSQSEVNKYFNKQYSLMGNDKKWEFAPKNLTVERKALKKINDESLVYHLNGHNYDLKVTQLFNLIHYSNGTYYYGNDDQFDDFANKINKENSTVHKKYQIITPDDQKVMIENKTYGWKLNNQETEKMIKKAFSTGEQVIDGKGAIQGANQDTNALGYGVNENNGLGKDYVLISIKQQKLWVIKDNQPIITLDNIVTGPSGNEDNQSSTGVWYITEKKSPGIVQARGRNSVYNYKAQYWLPLSQDGYGICDAGWRTDWSKSAGSKGTPHGQINLKPGDMKQVWDNVSKDEPVVIFDE